MLPEVWEMKCLSSHLVTSVKLYRKLVGGLRATRVCQFWEVRYSGMIFSTF